MNLEHAALLEIDLQKGTRALFKTAIPHDWETLVANNKALIEAFVAQNLPAYQIHVHLPKLLAGVAKKFPELIFRDDRAIDLEKHGPSVITQANEDLVAALKAKGVDTVVVAGVSTNNGVIKTARDAKKEGFTIIVVEDACAGRDLKGHEAAIQEARELGEVVTTSELLQKLESNRG
ncbi:MAG: cysteine hydrolase [Streptococcaceae bacterium]|jgi:nicotinamidase-related amidase|nr:cysteine hydrolase [Streptococcaceae bacterium]